MEAWKQSGIDEFSPSAMSEDAFVELRNSKKGLTDQLTSLVSDLGELPKERLLLEQIFAAVELGRPLVGAEIIDGTSFHEMMEAEYASPGGAPFVRCLYAQPSSGKSTSCLSIALNMLADENVAVCWTDLTCQAFDGGPTLGAGPKGQGVNQFVGEIRSKLEEGTYAGYRLVIDHADSTLSKEEQAIMMNRLVGLMQAMSRNSISAAGEYGMSIIILASDIKFALEVQQLNSTLSGVRFLGGNGVCMVKKVLVDNATKKRYEDLGEDKLPMQALECPLQDVGRVVRRSKAEAEVVRGHETYLDKNDYSKASVRMLVRSLERAEEEFDNALPDLKKPRMA